MINNYIFNTFDHEKLSNNNKDYILKQQNYVLMTNVCGY